MKSIGDLSRNYTPKKNPRKLIEQGNRELQKFIDDGKVRPDYNLAKFADKLFLPPRSTRIYQKRSINWQLSLFPEENEDPRIYPAEIIITPELGGRSGTTTTWKIFLGLVQIWEKNGKNTDGTIVFSARGLSSVLGEKMSGRTALKYLNEIDSLISTTYRWTWSFINENGDRINLVDKMSILAQGSYISKELRQGNNEQFDVLNRIVFNPEILKNMLSGNTIPVNFEAFISIKSGTSQSLYNHICIALSGKSYYERRSENLFPDLELSGKKYEIRRHRKTKLQELADSINGKAMANGVIKAFIKESSDGTDWKLCARRISSKNILPVNPVNSSSDISLLADDILAAIGQNESKGNWIKIAATFPVDLIQQAISEFKADTVTAKPQNPGKFFNAIVHRLAHQRGLDWIKPCGPGCKYRS